MARYLYLYPDPEPETPQNVPKSSSHSLFIGRSHEGRLLTVKPDQMAASESRTCISPASSVFLSGNRPLATFCRGQWCTYVVVAGEVVEGGKLVTS